MTSRTTFSAKSLTASSSASSASSRSAFSSESFPRHSGVTAHGLTSGSPPATETPHFQGAPSTLASGYSSRVIARA